MSHSFIQMGYGGYGGYGGDFDAEKYVRIGMSILKCLCKENVGLSPYPRKFALQTLEDKFKNIPSLYAWKVCDGVIDGRETLRVFCNELRGPVHYLEINVEDCVEGYWSMITVMSS